MTYYQAAGVILANRLKDYLMQECNYDRLQWLKFTQVSVTVKQILIL